VCVIVRQCVFTYFRLSGHCHWLSSLELDALKESGEHFEEFKIIIQYMHLMMQLMNL